MKPPLRYQAAMFAMGNLNADDLKSTIHELVDEGLWLDEFPDALDAKKPRMDEVLPAFLAALNHNGISLPNTEQAVLGLIDFHLREIALEVSDSHDELHKLFVDVGAHSFHPEYLESLGFENLWGLYWHGDILCDYDGSFDGKLGEAGWSALNRQIVIEAKHWLSANRPTF